MVLIMGTANAENVNVYLVGAVKIAHVVPQGKLAHLQMAKKSAPEEDNAFVVNVNVMKMIIILENTARNRLQIQGKGQYHYVKGAHTFCNLFLIFRCSELFECIEAILSNSTKTDGIDTSLNCTDYSIRLVDKIEELSLVGNEKICREIDAAGCTVVFKYTYQEDERLDIDVQEDRLCPKPLDILGKFVKIMSNVLDNT